MNRRTIYLSMVVWLASLLVIATAFSQQTYDSRVADKDIKIGNVTSYTGAAKEYGAIARAEAAYFRMINDHGGIKGRKIDFISLDNDSDIQKSLSLTKKLVDEEGVLVVFSSFGTESNLSVRAYLNERKVPQLFVDSSSAVFDDPAHFPWTMGFFATFRTEGVIYSQYILRTRPNAKIAILYANNDAGREYLAGVHEGLGDKASLIVKEISYETSDPDLTSQIAVLKSSGAGVFFNLSVGTAATRAIRSAYDMDWHPLQFIPNASLSTAAFLDPAGLEKATGIIANARSKGWLQAQSRNDLAVQEFVDWMNRYNPQASLRDQNNVAGYERAQALVEVLRKCGDDLSRENVMRNAASLDLELGMLRPGIKIKTSPNDYQPIKQLYLIRFNGRDWDSFGSVVSK